jgi:hypothetical protein
MTASRSPCGHLALILGLLGCSQAYGQEPTLQLTVQLTSKEPLPFQPVRLRFTLKNMKKMPCSGIMSWDRFIYVESVTSTEQNLESVGKYASLETVKHRLGFAADSSDYLELELAAGGYESISTTAIPGIDDDLIITPGAYTLLSFYSPGEIASERRPRVWANELRIRVGEPAADDAHVYKLLLEDRRLAVVMASSLVPQRRFFNDGSTRLRAETVDKLKSIIDKYPRCSYAEFARFALARHYVGEARLGVALPKGQPTAESKTFLGNAKTLLEAIDPVNFAYGPDVLRLLRELTPDEAGRKKLLEQLERHFGDDQDWLQSDRQELATLLNVVKGLTDDREELKRIAALLAGLDAPDGELPAREYLNRHHRKRFKELRDAKLIPVQRGPREWKPPDDKK